jgi:hypothetical protein
MGDGDSDEASRDEAGDDGGATKATAGRVAWWVKWLLVAEVLCTGSGEAWAATRRGWLWEGLKHSSLALRRDHHLVFCKVK